MRKILCLLLIYIIFCPFSFSKDAKENEANAVYLNLQDNNSTESVQKGSVEYEKLDVNYVPDEREKQHETLIYKDVNRMQPEKKVVSKTLEKEVMKDTSVGATYSTTENSGKMKDSVTVYSKYEKEHFGVTSAYSQSRDSYKQDGAGAGTVSLSPEVSLNKHFKIKNVNSQNLSTDQQKSEMVFSVRPFKDDRMDLDLGAGQTFSNSNRPAASQINVGTKIRF